MRVAAVALATLLLLPLAPLGAAEGERPTLLSYAWVTSATPGEPMTIFATVENWGYPEEAAAPAFDVLLVVDGQPLETFRVPPLEPYQYFEHESAPFALPEGIHSFEVHVDVNDEVAQTDETQNFISFDALVAHSVPDLRLEIVSVEQSGWPLATLTFRWEVCNQGDADMLGDVYLWGDLDRYQTSALGPNAGSGWSAMHPPLAAGECALGSRSFSTGAAVGSYKLRLWASHTGPRIFEEYSDNWDEADAFLTPVGLAPFP